jgi:hypothetical protein
MSDNRDRQLADLLELRLALVRPERPKPAPVPVLAAAVSGLPRRKTRARCAEPVRH